MYNRLAALVSVFALTILIQSIVTQSALAAQIIFQISGKSSQSFQSTFAICSDSVPQLYTIVFDTQEFRTIVWDNGHVTHTEVTKIGIYNSAGTLIAQNTNPNIVVDAQGGLPSMFQTNQVLVCMGASKAPGEAVNSKFGFTIGIDGQIKEVHLVSIG